MKIEDETVMHADGLLNARKIKHRAGGFDDCAIDGNWYEGQDGTRFWRITIVSADNYRSLSERINVHCLVSGGDFKCLEAGITVPGFECFTNGPADVDPTVRKKALAEISKWENEAARP